MPRLFIIDPSLKDNRGHHFMLTKAATLSAIGCGYEVSWLCSLDVHEMLDCGDAMVLPTFSSTMYDQYKHSNQPFIERLLLSLKRRLSRENATPPSLDSTFTTDLIRAINTHKIGPEDRMLLHTGDGESLPSILHLLTTIPADTLPIFHIATPYDPAGVMPNRHLMDNFSNKLSEIQKDKSISSKLFLYAENELLANHLTELWKIPVRTLNIPAYRTTNNNTETASYREETLGVQADNLLVTSLGSARLEKGFHLIPEILEHVQRKELETPITANRVVFALHASPQIIGRHPEITKALDRLKEQDPDRVKLLLEPLSEHEYQSLLNASNIILMPYGESEYRVRSSAVVTEAIASSKVLVATTNSYPGAMAKEYSGETGSSPEGLADAIMRIANDWNRYQTRAAEGAIKFNNKNSIANYWHTCLQAETEANM